MWNQLLITWFQNNMLTISATNFSKRHQFYSWQTRTMPLKTIWQVLSTNSISRFQLFIFVTHCTLLDQIGSTVSLGQKLQWSLLEVAIKDLKSIFQRIIEYSRESWSHICLTLMKVQNGFVSNLLTEEPSLLTQNTSQSLNQEQQETRAGQESHCQVQPRVKQSKTFSGPLAE